MVEFQENGWVIPMVRKQRLLTTPDSLSALRLAVVLATGACLLFLMLSTPPVAASGLEDQRLVSLLRQGGYTLYFRHVATDWSDPDRLKDADDWLSCDPTEMRQLSDSGREDARRIGMAIRAMGIPLGEILASPYCRTMETARLFDLGIVRATHEVINLRAEAYVGGRVSIIAKARRLLATKPATGTNTVIVAHGNVAREATPVYPDEGEAVVFQADGRGGFKVVARIPVDRWQRLLNSAGN